MPDGEPPDLTVVVPSVNGWKDLDGALGALAAQRGAARLEVVVADRVGEPVRGPLRRLYAGVRLIEAAPDTSIPALRRLGFQAARAPVVGVIEDHVLVPPDWAERMLEAQRTGAPVVGGAVENAATGSLVDWSAFLCEYSQCLSPPAGPARWVTGNNVTYRRELLERFADRIAEDRWEDHLHAAMREAGITLLSRPDIVVQHRKHTTVAEYVAQRYLYARSFGALRVARAGALRRVAYGMAALALPAVLLARIVRRVWASGRHRRELVLSLPLLAVYVMAWAAGEVVGAWFGAGTSLSRVT
jgi:hypothetical protein